MSLFTERGYICAHRYSMHCMQTLFLQELHCCKAELGKLYTKATSLWKYCMKRLFIFKDKLNFFFCIIESHFSCSTQPRDVCRRKEQYLTKSFLGSLNLDHKTLAGMQFQTCHRNKRSNNKK